MKLPWTQLAQELWNTRWIACNVSWWEYTISFPFGLALRASKFSPLTWYRFLYDFWISPRKALIGSWKLLAGSPRQCGCSQYLPWLHQQCHWGAVPQQLRCGSPVCCLGWCCGGPCSWKFRTLPINNEFLWPLVDLRSCWFERPGLWGCYCSKERWSVHRNWIFRYVLLEKAF